MSEKRIKLSDQIRRAVDESGLSRYRICKDAGIDQATFSRFMAGKVGLSMTTLDALADVLGLELRPKKKR
jgi:transcriptional regulator with XRE-family HTH domain